MDPIADMLTKIRNAQAAKKNTVSIPFSNLKYNILKVLEKEGFIESIKKRGKKTNKIIISLKYNKDGSPRINYLKRVSKSGRRVYMKSKNVYFPKSGYGVLLLSTQKGILTSKEAKKEKTGGEVLCEVW